MHKIITGIVFGVLLVIGITATAYQRTHVKDATPSNYISGSGVSIGDVTIDDDLDVIDSLVCGDATIDEAAGVLNFSGATSATISTTTADLTLAPVAGKSLVCGADVNTGGYDIYNQSAKTSDAAPDVSTISMGQDAYEFSVTNKTGGATYIVGGIGTTNTQIIDFSQCTGKTVTLSGTNTGGTTWSETYTEAAGAPLGWAKGASNAEAATNLAATITAAPTASLYVTASAGGVGGAFVGIKPIPGKIYSLTIATNATACDTITNGNDGGIQVLSVGIGCTPNGGCTFAQGISITSGSVTASQNLNATAGYVAAGSYIQATTSVEAKTDMYLGDDILNSVANIATDAVPTTMVINTQQPTTARGATNNDGSNLILAPGQGMINLTGVTKAGTAGDTLTITTYCQGVASAPVVLTEGVSWVCAAAADDNTCVSNLYDVLKSGGSSPVTGVSVAYTASTEAMTFYPAQATCEYVTVTPSDGTNMVFTVGDPGQVRVANGSALFPSISYISDPDTGFYFSSGTLFSYGGSMIGGFKTNGIAIADTMNIYWLTRALMSSPADAQFAMKNNGGTSGVVLDTNDADGVAVVKDKAGTASGFWANLPQTITCATSGDGNHSTCGGAAITIASNIIQLVCEDADGCTFPGFAETNFSATVSGLVTVTGPAANHVDISDSAGVLELDGGVAFAMVSLDTLQIVYAPAATTWLEVNRKTDL